MKSLGKISLYYLLIELLNEGDAGLIPEIEPIEEQRILVELRRRTGQDFGNRKEDWGRWFVGSADHGTEIERANLLIFMDTRARMNRIWERVSRGDSNN